MIRRDTDGAIVTAIEKEAYPFEADADDYDPIINAAAGKDFVFLGAASHGTKEFYAVRADITRRLIEEAGFEAVAIEADWPDAYAVNRYISGFSEDDNADDAMSGFERFPAWMWRNTDTLHFVEWLRGHNTQRRHPVGFYGLDLYGMNASINAVLAYLSKIDPLAARRARNRYACLDHFMDKPQAYGYATELGVVDSCEKQIIQQLEELRRRSLVYIEQNGLLGEDEYFCAVQNAQLVHNAEQYYRALFRKRPESWNLRSRHMFTTLDQLARHRGQRLGRNAKTIVWAHNSHVGNAGATEMLKRGEVNLGQLARAAYSNRLLTIGFSTSHGEVLAASNWDESPEVKTIGQPFAGSYEDLFHKVNYKNFFLDLRQQNLANDLLQEPRMQRAIGVVYKPETEWYSHYLFSTLTEQFDFMLHMDHTSALNPLEATISFHPAEMNETYPTGI